MPPEPFTAWWTRLHFRLPNLWLILGSGMGLWEMSLSPKPSYVTHFFFFLLQPSELTFPPHKSFLIPFPAGTCSWFTVVVDPELQFSVDPRWPHLGWRNIQQSACVGVNKSLQQSKDANTVTRSFYCWGNWGTEKLNTWWSSWSQRVSSELGLELMQTSSCLRYSNISHLVTILTFWFLHLIPIVESCEGDCGKVRRGTGRKNL